AELSTDELKWLSAGSASLNQEERVGAMNEELRSFERTGYWGPHDLPPELLEPYREGRLQRLIPLWDTSTDLERKRSQHLFSKSLVQLVTSAPIVERVNAALGRDVLLWTAHVVSRLAGSDGQPWHSDAINQYLRGLHLSLALSATHRKNGCMKVIPGTH